jgi:hypothetical protein
MTKLCSDLDQDLILPLNELIDDTGYHLFDEKWQ